MDLSKLQIKYIDAFERRVSLDGKTQKDKILPCMTVVYPYRGYYQVCLGDEPLQTLEHGAGCYITAPGARHTIVHRISPGETDMIPRWILFSVTYDQVLDVTAWFQPPLLIKGGQAEPFIRAVDTLVELNKEASGYEVAFRKMAVAGQLLEALLQICDFRPVALELERIYPAVLLVKDQFSQPITVEQMAQRCNMSASTFYRIFRQITGMTPMQYLEQYRLQQASQMLLFEKQTLAQVADRCGYYDEFHFSRNFKRRYGVSPGEYKKRSKL